MFPTGRLLLIVGTIVAVAGLFFLGQGLGYVRWPASSFMVDQFRWVVNGSLIAVVGLVLVLIGRRLRR